MKLNKLFVVLTCVAAFLVSCENEDIEFPDFDYQTVYFANPYYVRTIELGDDLGVDLSLDNEYKIKINAYMGGVHQNNKNRIIDFEVNESLCENLYFSEGGPIIPMPSAYYQLASDRIVIPSGSAMGGVEVQLTDAFFADPKSLENTYAIPLIMTDVQGADSILQGNPLIAAPDRCVDSHWSVVPKDFVICVVKYVNPWHAYYLRRGVDQITNAGGTTTSIRHAQYVENDELVNTTTNSLTESILTLNIKDDKGINIYYDLSLTFADNGTCTVGGSTDSYEISGSGKFVSKGEKNSVGGEDRDALYLDYQVDFKDLGTKYVTKDTLVVRNRGIVPEYFTVIRN